MPKKKEKYSESFLYGVIVLLLLLVSVLAYSLYEMNFRTQPVYQSVELVYNGDQVNPLPIEKPIGVLRAEEDLRIVRSIEKTDDGMIVVEAFLKNLDRLEDDVVVQDMVETIRFDSRVLLSEGEVEALSGRLFPQGKTINLANWGPGPQSEKKTKINVTVLDLNLDSSMKDTVGLYRLEFVPDKNVDLLKFDAVEFRFNEHIFSFGGEEISI